MTSDTSPSHVAPPPVSADEPWPSLPDGWWRGTAPHATFPVPYTLPETVLTPVWFLLGQQVAALILGLVLLGGGGSLEGPALLALGLAAQVFVLATTLLFLRVRGHLDWRSWGPIRPRAVHLAIGAGFGLAGFLLIQIPIGLVLTLLGDTDPPQQALLGEIGSDTLTTVLLVLIAVVMAPIVEEFVFRGVLFQGLRRRVGLWPAALLSSMLFGVMHLEVVRQGARLSVVVGAALVAVAAIPAVPRPVQVLSGALGLAALAYTVAVGGPSALLLPGALAFLGFVLALAFHRTGNLLVPILGHAAFNGVALSIATFAESMDLGV